MVRFTYLLTYLLTYYEKATLLFFVSGGAAVCGL